jgi:hypothetical protein
MPDGWETYFGTDPVVDDAELDPDLDELKNYLEYLSRADPRNPDTDYDGMPDGWEYTNLLNPTDDADAGIDSDLDELVNLDEYLHSTNPQDADTEDDTLPDGWEISYQLNPLEDDALGDPDCDVLTNAQEFGYGTNPQSCDTDGDGLWDNWELQFRARAGEETWDLDPLIPDTDGNGVIDADEDFDQDGVWLLDNEFDVYYVPLTNLAEFEHGTNPYEIDTDNDGLPDGWEINYKVKKEGVWDLDPLKLDTDDDGIPDPDEDFDHDGAWLYNETLVLNNFPYTNLEEFNELTDPHKGDTDGDRISDGWEVHYNLNPTYPKDGELDYDKDELTNLQEYNYDLDPHNPDTEYDGMPDGWEIKYYLNPIIDDSLEDHDVDKLVNIQEYWNNTDPWSYDTDEDDMSDWFEIEISGTVPYIENNKFAILFNTGNPNDPEWLDSALMYDLLTNYYSYDDTEIWKFEQAAANKSNLKNAILEIAALADENDTVYIGIGCHGGKNVMICSDGSLHYAKLDDWVDNITCSKLIITIDDCHSGSAIPHLNDGDNPCDRIIYTAVNPDELSNGRFHYNFTDAQGLNSAKYAIADQDVRFGDDDGAGNGYVSVREAYLYAANWVLKKYNVHALESDPSVMWENVYLGEYRL